MKKEDCTTNEGPGLSCSAMLNAIADTQYVIGGKWTLRVIIALSDQPRRFNELQKLIEGISARVLSNELKDLELNGFIHRKIDAKAKPVIVEYELAAYSHSLSEVVKSMVHWGLNHREKIKQRMV
jgi:DNA-binding HxlR family transcriptional regulator